MKGPKAVQASAGEKAMQAVGKLQHDAGSAIKSKLLGGIKAFTDRDDSAVLRNAANAGNAQSLSKALGQAKTAEQRAAVVTGSTKGAAIAKNNANVTAGSTMINRLTDGIKLGLGGQAGSASAVSGVARAQQNAAFTVADAKMRNQAATMNALGNVVTTYGAVKKDMNMANELARQRALDSGQSYYNMQNSMFDPTKKISMPVDGPNFGG